MLNYQRVFCKDLLTTPVVCEWSVFRGQIICEFGSSSLSLFLPVVAQIPHFDGWTFLFVWLHLHISYVFQCISNVFPVAKVMLSLNFPFFPVKLQPPGLGAEFQGGRRQSQLLLVSRLSYLGSLCGASDHCGYQVRSSEGSGRCNLMVSEVTIITIYMDGHFTSLVDFLLIDGIY